MKWILLVFLLISCSNSDEDMRLFISSLNSPSESPTPPEWVLPENSVRITGYTGQSNCPGNGFNSQALASEIDETTWLQIWRSNNNNFQNLDIASGNNYPNGSQWHSIELGLSLAYEQANDYPLYLAKKGVGGTEITKHLKGGQVYQDFWWNFLAPAINYHLAQGKRVFVDLIFLQGENDADGSWKQSAYSDNLNAWISQWRSNLGAELPISFIEIFQRNSSTTAINNDFASKVDNNIKVIEASTLTTNDNLHYDYASHKIIAERYMTRIDGVTPLEITSQITLPTDTTPPATMTFTSIIDDGGTYTIIGQLNGGDAVTNDNDLIFRLFNNSWSIYFTSGSANNDANVSVIGDEVTVTNIPIFSFPAPLDEMWIQSIDESGNYSATSNYLTVPTP